MGSGCKPLAHSCLTGWKPILLRRTEACRHSAIDGQKKLFKRAMDSIFNEFTQAGCSSRFRAYQMCVCVFHDCQEDDAEMLDILQPRRCEKMCAIEKLLGHIRNFQKTKNQKTSLLFSACKLSSPGNDYPNLVDVTSDLLRYIKLSKY